MSQTCEEPFDNDCEHDRAEPHHVECPDCGAELAPPEPLSDPADEVWVVDLQPGLRWHPIHALGTATECRQSVAYGRIVGLAEAKALGMGECGLCYRARRRRASS